MARKPLFYLLIQAPKAGCFKYDPIRSLLMSRLAKGLLILAVLSATLGCFSTENTLGDAPLIACGVFSGLFLLALAVGRKIKFDPVLR